MKKELQKLVLKGLGPFVRTCPKSGRIVGFTVPKNASSIYVILFPVVGILAIVWLLIRTLPKPSRLSYPCQRIAAGIGVAFITWLVGMFSSILLFKKVKKLLKNLPAPAVTITALFLCCGLGLGVVTTLDSLTKPSGVVYADWNPGEGANKPLGTAQGINPGRVTWIRNPDATANTVSGSWWQPGNTNQQVVKDMCAASIMALTGAGDVKSAWDGLFKYYNQKKGKGSVGYQSGETVAIKINTVNTYSQSKMGSAIDCCAETLLSIVDQLVTAGVPQTSIVVYAGGPSTTIGSYVYDCVNKVYPQVSFEANSAWGNVKAITWVDNGITYSSMSSVTSDADSRRVAGPVWNATYLINLALLKKHEDQTAVTLCGKNHFGSVKNCRPIHTTINDQTKGMGTYNSLVDLAGHQRIGGKTVLYIIDGLWGSSNIMGSPVKWTTFNNDWPSSIFMSEDFVAIDSVGLDFINSEFTLWDNGDNYLHEAAQAGNPPSGIVYDPEADGTRLQSLGVHEHWNNATSKQYSRNLGTGSGIELVQVGTTPATSTPTPTRTPTGTPTGGLLGDVNNSRTVDINDALLVAQYSAGLNPTGFVAANADVNRDGQISIVDALQIARYSAGLITGF